MDRKSFFKNTLMGGIAIGYSGMFADESFSNPKNATVQAFGPEDN